MTATSPQGLALVARVAHVLTSGAGPEELLRGVVTLLRDALGVRRVALWHRAPAATHAVAATDPLEELHASGLDALPPAATDVVRVPLVHGGATVGVLELQLVDPATMPDREVLGIVADVIAPHLDARQLSEDLATEVTTRTREIDAQRRFTSLIIDSLPVGLYVIDREYRIQIWNRKRETGTQGLRRETVVGRPVFEVLTRQPRETLQREFDRVFHSGEVIQYEIEVRTGDRPRYYRLSKLPMRLEGDEVTHVITIGEDMTEARTTDQRIRQSEKLAAIGQLGAGVMHEINNPLATIGACVAAMEGRLGDVPGALPAVREYLEIVEKEVERCTRIVDGLLDFARPKPDQGARGPTDLGALLEQTLFLVKHHRRFKRVDVTKELAYGLPPVLVDSEQMIQVFMALMLNAVDAMEARNSAGTTRLTVRTRRHPARSGEVLAEIEDTGVGIARADLEKIFEPFYTTKGPGRGTGLGLAICYGIVEQHRGHIEVESEPGRGSVFRVVLPLHGGDQV